MARRRADVTRPKSAPRAAEVARHRMIFAIVPFHHASRQDDTKLFLPRHGFLYRQLEIFTAASPMTRILLAFPSQAASFRHGRRHERRFGRADSRRRAV